MMRFEFVWAVLIICNMVAVLFGPTPKVNGIILGIMALLLVLNVRLYRLQMERIKQMALDLKRTLQHD